MREILTQLVLLVKGKRWRTLAHKNAGHYPNAVDRRNVARCISMNCTRTSEVRYFQMAPGPIDETAARPTV